MKIIAYTYEADYHCPECASSRFGIEPGYSWVREDATDSEGNSVHPVFAIDEWWEPSEEGLQTLACSDCGRELDIVELHSAFGIAKPAPIIKEVRG